MATSIHFRRSLPALLATLATLFAALALAPEDTQAAVITYTIDSTDDMPDSNIGNGLCKNAADKCSLRAAINEASTHGGNSFIFNFSGIGAVNNIPKIAPTAALPQIPFVVTMDGSTSPAGRVEISGQNTTGTTSGLVILVAGAQLKYLIINRFPANGLILVGGSATVTLSKFGFANGELDDYGNGVNGILINGGGNNSIGPGNHFGYNGNTVTGVGAGIEINGSAAPNTITNNTIGANLNADPASQPRGVFIRGSSDGNTVGGSISSINLVAASTVAGVVISGSGTTGNTVSNLDIGTNGNASALGNAIGVLITDSASNNVIGGTPATGNWISGNVTGIRLDGSSSATTIASNIIGMNLTGDAALPNTGGGVIIQDSANNTTAGNLISGNGAPGGISISGASSTNNSILGNYIGLNLNGTLAVPNVNTGVSVLFGATSTTIGGSSESRRNVIVGAVGGSAVRVSGDATHDTAIQGNYIGTDKTGAVALGSGSTGISLAGTGATIGGEDPGERNLISGNSIGVDFASGGAGSTVFGNLIGTAADGSTPLPNQNEGIDIVSASNDDITIGGTEPGRSNTIAFNGGKGITIHSNDSLGIRILGNSIHDNGGLGIDLGNDGITENDAGDSDNGANRRQNFPEMTPNDNGTVTAVLHSMPNTVYDISLYHNTACDSSGNGEGESYLYSVAATTDANGDTTLVAAVPIGPVAALVTDVTTGDTSEFSDCVIVPVPTSPTPTPSPSPSPTLVPTPTPTGQTPSPTPTSSPSPTPTSSASPTPTAAPTLRQGDFNCDGNVDVNDLNIVLQFVALGTPFQGPSPCPAFGSAGPPLWGDVNCDGLIDVNDVLAMLLHLAQLPYTKTDPCTAIGAAFP